MGCFFVSPARSPRAPAPSWLVHGAGIGDHAAMPQAKARAKKAATKPTKPKRAASIRRPASGKPPVKTTIKTEKPSKPAPEAKAPRRTSGADTGPYSVHPGVHMMIKWAAELPEKTGRSLDQWVYLVKSKAPRDFQARVAWLKTEHKMGTNTAWWIAERADGKGDEDLDPKAYLRAALGYVEEQYAGKKSALRPLYEKLLRRCLSLGRDAAACPCKTMVPIYRTHVIAQLKPTTNTRIDLGLALGNAKAAGRLIDTGGYAKKDRITHRIEISNESDIDTFVEKWLQAAYDREGGKH